ncbi:hypothetical protein DL762_002714 [Monosporascus cannonballus]|uniref:Ecp2 effector protein domain-containing protein n=1 Tax=Monosporascus cannonballus TaxID=155416 RepID=A0ABY0HCP6_9PEZI|nr:hypothetical protein DL762_002714 [Monosporascus cannonballus]RYO97654.1 hypothetical protein DL763_002631 [Monosporascus cannonballus]
MQFATLALALAAASVAKAQDPVASVDVYNFSTCDVDAAASFELPVGECLDFEQGYGSANYSLSTGSAEYLLAAFAEKACAGNVKVTGPTGCLDNTDGVAIWSVGLITAPGAVKLNA